MSSLYGQGLILCPADVLVRAFGVPQGDPIEFTLGFNLQVKDLECLNFSNTTIQLWDFQTKEWIQWPINLLIQVIHMTDLLFCDNLYSVDDLTSLELINPQSDHIKNFLPKDFIPESSPLPDFLALQSE